MTNIPPSIDELRDSFNRVYHGPDSLRREYELTIEAERLGVHIDIYRRLYELRGEEEIDPYPKPKRWWHTPGEWGKWVWHLPLNKKLALGRKGLVKVVQSGVVITAAIALGRYVWEAPNREKQRHYQAWQMINSAKGQKTSGGRIEALQDLVKDGVSLQGLDAPGAYLYRIKLQNAELRNANLNNANLDYADLGNATFTNANLAKAELNNADLGGAILAYANLSDAKLIRAELGNAKFLAANLVNATLVDVKLMNADLYGVNLTSADLDGADLYDAKIGCNIIATPLGNYCTNFKGAKNITTDQIKKARSWEKACYDPEFRIKLGLPLQNPECAGEKPIK